MVATALTGVPVQISSKIQFHHHVSWYLYWKDYREKYKLKIHQQETFLLFEQFSLCDQERGRTCSKNVKVQALNNVKVGVQDQSRQLDEREGSTERPLLNLQFLFRFTLCRVIQSGNLLSVFLPIHTPVYCIPEIPNTEGDRVKKHSDYPSKINYFTATLKECV